MRRATKIRFLRWNLILSFKRYRRISRLTVNTTGSTRTGIRVISARGFDAFVAIFNQPNVSGICAQQAGSDPSCAPRFSDYCVAGGRLVTCNVHFQISQSNKATNL
jgi:hypothetical protein